jgi:hypothetical protein
LVLFDDSHLGMTSTSSVARSRQSPLEGPSVVFESVRDLNTLQRLVLSSQILSHNIHRHMECWNSISEGILYLVSEDDLFEGPGGPQSIVKAVDVDVEVN